MDIYSRIISIICNFKAYNKDNVNLQSEMYAYSKGLEIISNRLMNVEKECFVSTAEDYGLTVKERYFDSITRASDVKSRREMLLSLLSVDETDFNLDGMNKFMKQFPVSSKITEFATTNRILITFDKNDWIVSNFDFVKSCVEDFFPSHLNILLQVNK